MKLSAAPYRLSFASESVCETRYFYSRDTALNVARRYSSWAVWCQVINVLTGERIY